MTIVDLPWRCPIRWGKLLLLLCFAFTLSSCAALLGGLIDKDSGTTTYPEDWEQAGSGTISFTILQMNDVYEIAPLDSGRVGGMARVATLRNRLLEENFNLLTVLAGDFLSPSLLGTLKYEGESIKGRHMVEVMNELGVNLVAFGNHEFDLKEQELQSRLNESYFEWLGTNVLHRHDNKLEPFYKDSWGYKYFLPETYIWEVYDYITGNALKIGFYSACINDNQREYVYYEDPYAEAQKAYLELLAQQVEVVIGLTHLELPMDMKLATLLPKTALIMGGHEHENSIDTVGKVVITKADANAKTVYLHRFVYDKTTKELTLNSELVPINADIENDSAVGAVIDKWQQVLSREIEVIFPDPYEVIYVANEPLDGRDITGRNQQTNLGGIIAQSFAFVAKKPVDCAFFNAGSIRIDDQLKGNVTPVDIFRTLPFGGNVVEVELKGSLLKKVLDAGLENKGIGGYLQWHKIEFNETNRSWKVNGKPLDPAKVYRVATSDFLFSGRETRLEFFKKDNKEVVRWETAKEGDEYDLRHDVRKAVVAYLKGKI